MASEPSSITDVKNGFEAESSVNNNVSTPYVKQLVRSSVRRWKANHETAINKRIEKIKLERKKRRLDEMFSESRQIPLDVLAREWMENNPMTSDIRIYLIEKLMPFLIMGLEKLLTEAEKRELVDSERPSQSFNPVNYLAQYLMRNNPVYSNFPEASPYAKGLRKVAEDLKNEIFEMDTNRLARLKAEAQQKRMERERMERMKGDEYKKRNILLEELFIEWAPKEGTIPLDVVQNALLSFLKLAETLPENIRSDVKFALNMLPEIDSSGRRIDVSEFLEVLEKYAISLSNEAFAKLMEHFFKCAYHYQHAAERLTIRYNLQSLFLACDHDAIGVLERKRVLEILSNYYDSSTEDMKESFRNPKDWPIDVVEEYQDDERGKGDEKAMKTEEVSEENNLDNQGEIRAEMKEAEVDNEMKRELEQDQEGKDVNGTINTEGTDRNDSKNKVKIEQDKSVEKIESRHSETRGEDELYYDEKEVMPEPTQKASEDELSSLSGHSQVDDGSQSVPPCSAFDENHVNQTQFVTICERFLGDEPIRSALDSLVRFIQVSYSETDEERFERQRKARQEARTSKRKFMVEQLFDVWDVDKSGTLKLDVVLDVLSKWKEISASPSFQEYIEKNGDLSREITCTELHDFVESISTICFPDEDPFEPIIIFLHTSIERTFEERKRGEARKGWLNMIENASKTSGGTLGPVYQATFNALCSDAETYGRNKIINSSISLLENNLNPEKLDRGKTVLHYVAATPNDIPFVLNKYLYRDMKSVNFATVDSGKPIHIAKVDNHPGVYLWNPERKATGATGSMIVLPLKNHEKEVTGILTVDTMDDPQDKSVFITHEISYYQGVTKALSQAMQFVDIRSKTVKIADSAVSWIRRRSQNVKSSCFYLVEPGLHPADGQVLRKMFSIDSNRKREQFLDPPRMNRKDNLFRDYLFKCIESSETITADAYGERHVAFPIRDANGVTIAIVDASIGDVKVLPSHEMKEIQKMLRLLAMAHREVASEITAGVQKNIVLEVEKENEDFRIEIMFDRLMLTDLRENVARLDSRAFAEIKSYKDPPQLVHDILKTVLGIFHAEQEEKFESWMTCKAFINADLVKMITQYDPTAASSIMMVDGKKLSETLEGIPHGTVAKQGSLPAQYLFNWAFVCLSLIEHTAKMNQSLSVKPISTVESTSEESGTPTSQN